MTRRHELALVTAGHLPAGNEDAEGLIAALSRAGTRPELVPWDATGVDWSNYGTVMLHSPWDYTWRADEFARWISTVSHESQLLNPATLVSWNSSKHYLLELQDRGVALPRTHWLGEGEQLQIDEVIDVVGSGPLVIKPAVGAGGRRMARVQTPELLGDSELIVEGRAVRDLLIQEFVDGILHSGEISVVLLGGEFSHAVRKTPRPGEFRTQPQHGGSVALTEIDAQTRRFASSVMDSLSTPPPYARVDLCLTPSEGPVLMEFELIEPDLFLRHHPPSFRRLAAAVTGRL